jgi:hypothetical protein
MEMHAAAAAAVCVCVWLVTSTHHFAGPNRLEENTQLIYINS